MTNKNGTMDPTALPKEDPARRAGIADDNKAGRQREIEGARLAIEDCEEGCETAAEEIEERTKGKDNDE